MVAADPMVEHQIKPSTADPAVTRFDESNIAIARKDLSVTAPLVLFLPGTGGKPENVRGLLTVVAEQGYRTLGLSYDDVPAVVQVCPRVPDPDCSAHFRQMRLDGSGPGAPGVSNPAAEGIVARLVATLRALDRAEPEEGWGGYLSGDTPRWDRIVLSGLSQGAGMAAYLAKSVPVRRVVLFSSPWDFTQPDRKLAPWMAGPSATPPERWFAEYHKREATADLLAESYRALGIPNDHVLVFDRDLPGNGGGPNPYHGSTVRDPGYAAQWRFLYGAP
ncbi:hypothetical protein DBR17_02845 [Sphingomonas sp. HMWF008]|nr:hypothetical protein DBR17_02845 [Sphingomonas sp. HMWF008]